MASKLLQDWLGTYDPIHRGWTRAGIANGLTATNGFSFPRVRGGYNLYRTAAGDPNSPVLVGAAGADAVEIQPFAWVSHDPSSEYMYRLVPVGGGGVENWTDITETAVWFDESGAWVGPLPNAPTDLQAIPLSMGRVAVRWSYFPHGEQTAPEGFHLYGNVGTDIDYGSIAGSTPYQPGQVHYEFITLPQPDGIKLGWAVRAFAPSQQEEQNLNRVFVLTRRLGPPANPVVRVTVV